MKQIKVQIRTRPLFFSLVTLLTSAHLMATDQSTPEQEPIGTVGVPFPKRQLPGSVAEGTLQLNTKPHNWTGIFWIGEGYIQHTPQEVTASGNGLTHTSNMSITINPGDQIWIGQRVSANGLHIASYMDHETFMRALANAGLFVHKSKISLPIALPPQEPVAASWAAASAWFTRDFGGQK